MYYIYFLFLNTYIYAYSLTIPYTIVYLFYFTSN